MVAGMLSGNDSAVLSALFDPESSLSSAANINYSTPETIDSERLSLLQNEERNALRPLNQKKPSKSDIEHALSKLSDIVESNPDYASALVNRAQAQRLLVQDGELSKNPELVLNISEDLAKAISLTTPKSPTDSVSAMDAKILAAAHTHRGYLLLLASKSEENRHMMDSIKALRDLRKEDLEEMASRELALGGRYGNETARQLAVKTNPYAKLCGSIVKEALQKEISDYYQIPVFKDRAMTSGGE